MGKIILYHGSQNEKITPQFGLGNEKHDYGKGFYLTESLDLAKEWAVYQPEGSNASYFYIAKAFVRDEVDVDILEELLSLGGLGVQYCIKTEKAYENLAEISSDLQTVSFGQFNEKYNERDITARENMRKLIDSDRNQVTNVFSTLL